METIKPKLVTDAERRPVAVQLDYDDWLRIEPILRERGYVGETPSLEALADAVRPHWRGGDGLEFQTRLREEWEDRP